MATLYTYNDFENKKHQLGLDGQISQADLDLAKKNPDAGIKLLEAKVKWNTAADDIGRQSANAEAEKIRSTYGGYTGGSTGANWDINAPATPSSFESEYDDLINAEIKNFQNSKFEYDPDTDPALSAYKKAYTREGRRASEDTIAQAAAMTGGIPSSYAVSAGQQAGNYYASQIADKIPDLEQRAYDRYRTEKADLLNLIQLGEKERESQYQKHIDNVNYEMLLDDIERSENQIIKDEKRQQTLDELSKAELAASVGDYSLLKDLNINASLPTNDEENQRKQFSDALKLAEAAASVGDYSYYEALGITPNIKEGNSSEYIHDAYTKYGSTMSIPSNVASAYEVKYPGAWQALTNEGFTIDLSEADVKTLNSLYHNNIIPAEAWDTLISEGFSESNLKENGFIKKTHLKGH